MQVMAEYSVESSATLDALETDCLTRICKDYETASKADCQAMIAAVNGYEAQDKIKQPFLQKLQSRIESIWSAEDGEVFDNKALTAAHKSLTFGTIVSVTNDDNGKSIEVRINDRGPYVENRIIDLTPEGARQLGFYEEGIAPVTLEVVSEPEVPESQYINGADTGWYTIQIGTYTNMDNAYALYTNLKTAGLKPTVEIIEEAMVRISLTPVQAYRLNDTLASLSQLGITEPLVRGARNPYTAQ